MATTITSPTRPAPSPQTLAAPEAPEHLDRPEPERSRRRIGRWLLGVTLAGSIAALAFALASAVLDDDGTESGPVFTEHAQLHATDSPAPAAASGADVAPTPEGDTFTEHAQMHVADSPAPAAASGSGADVAPTPAGDTFTEHAQVHVAD